MRNFAQEFKLGSSMSTIPITKRGAELLKELDEQIKNYVDGGQPLTWITG